MEAAVQQRNEKWHCCAKRIFKSKCRNRLRFGPICKVQMSKCTPLWREAHFLHRTPHARTNFESFAGKKNAHRCGAKRICKSKCTKHRMFGPLFEAQMSKNRTRLRREAHVQVKMQKTPQVCGDFESFDVEKLHATAATTTTTSTTATSTTTTTTPAATTTTPAATTTSTTTTPPTTTYYLLLATSNFPLTTYHLPLTTYHVLRTTYY